MRKKIALILALAMLFSMIVPMSASADSAASYRLLSSRPGAERGDVRVEEGTPTQPSNFGNVRIQVTIPQRALDGPETLFVTVPTGVQVNSWNARVTDGTYNSDFHVGLGEIGEDELNGTTVNGRTDIEIPVIPNNETVNTNEGEVKFVIELRDIYVGSNFTADTLNFVLGGQAGTVFAGRTSIAASAVGEGRVDVEVLDINVITDAAGQDQAIGTIRIEESQASAFRRGDDVSFELPRGFYWDGDQTEGSGLNINTVYGDGELVLRGYDQNVRSAQNRPQRVRFDIAEGGQSSEPTAWEITGLQITVDPTLASFGEVEASVRNAEQSSVPVALYGEYLAEVSGESKPTRLAGKASQGLGDFMIKELIGDTLVENRTVTMTLPSGVKWTDGRSWDDPAGEMNPPAFNNAPSLVRGDSTNYEGFTNTDDWNWEVVDVAGRVLRGRIPAGPRSTNNPAELYFDAPNVAISPDFDGDEIVVTFGGSAGVGGEVALADVVKPLEAEVVGDVADLRLGVQNQPVSDILLTEALTGALDRDGTIVLEPVWGDTRFATKPEVEVVSGDIMIEEIWTSANRRQVMIEVSIDSDSEPAELLISGLEVSLDRTAPEGTLELEISGDAVIDNEIFQRGGYFAGASVSNTVPVGQVITAAPGETVEEAKEEVSFTVGSTSYTVGGQAMTMDVAPYISNDRLMVPVRYLEPVFEMQPNWNEASRTVTVLYEGNVFGMTIGSNMITRNGADFVEMDATAEITNARTFVPASRFARAMGIDYEWDAMTNTATFK